MSIPKGPMTKFSGSNFGLIEDSEDVYSNTEFDDFSFEEIRDFRMYLKRVNLEPMFTKKGKLRNPYRFDQYVNYCFLLLNNY